MEGNEIIQHLSSHSEVWWTMNDELSRETNDITGAGDMLYIMPSSVNQFVNMTIVGGHNENDSESDSEYFTGDIT